jgi:hypothetical protein
MVYVLGCFGARLLRRRAASLRDGDADRLVKVHAALNEIWRDEPLPRVTLTDAVASRVVLGRRGHATRLDVSRRAIDARPSALRGELAHEYAHVIDPVVRADILIERCAAFLLICAAPVLTYRVLGVQPSTLSGYWLGVGIQALVVTLIVLLASAPFSRARELRTDATAAELLGSTAAVLAMLWRLHANYLTRPLYHRVAAQLTHPHPADRVHALLSSTVDARHTDPISAHPRTRAAREEHPREQPR